jgi:hypothetical protein
MVMNPQQPSQPRGGLLGLFDKAMKTNEDTGLSPLQNFAAALDPLILKDLRGGEGIRQQGVQRAASMSKNKTVDMLRKQGRDDLADALLNRTIGTKEAFSVMQSEKAADTAFQRQKDLASYRAGLTSQKATGRTVSAEQLRKLFPGTKIADGLYNLKPDGTASKVGGGGVTINTGDSSLYGKAPEGSVWAKDASGQHVMEETSPGSGKFRPSILPLEGSNAETRAAKLEETRRKNTRLADGAFDAVTLIDDIYNDPALPGVTGMFQGRAPALSQEGTDLVEKIDQLKGKAFLQAFETLKGGGQITEREGLAATKAIARLERKQSPEAYKKSLMALRSVVERVRARALGQEVPEYSDEEFQVLLKGFGPDTQNSNASSQKTKTGVSFTILNEGANNGRP